MLGRSANRRIAGRTRRPDSPNGTLGGPSGAAVASKHLQMQSILARGYLVRSSDVRTFESSLLSQKKTPLIAFLQSILTIHCLVVQ